MKHQPVCSHVFPNSGTLHKPFDRGIYFFIFLGAHVNVIRPMHGNQHIISSSYISKSTRSILFYSDSPCGLIFESMQTTFRQIIRRFECFSPKFNRLARRTKNNFIFHKNQQKQFYFKKINENQKMENSKNGKKIKKE